MNKGRHAAETSSSFYRDLTMMVLGIALVGAAVFLLLYLLAGDPEAEAGATTDSGSTTSTERASSEPIATTSTSSPPTTTPASTAAPATTAVPVRPPQEVRVVVLNSIGLAGAAGRKTQELADAGYQTQQAEDIEPQQDQSRVWYREGFAAEANALLQFLPGALVEPIPDPELQTGTDVVLVLGAGYIE
ncbi:MAG TPA: LytR C-terminal domain-containing protein [Acidimicrobiia bacterium]|nr:LytR C-terminal domain-containing protein [Acidimicrobiia bacterium]